MSEIKERGNNSLHAYVPPHLAVKSSQPLRWFVCLHSPMGLQRYNLFFSIPNFISLFLRWSLLLGTIVACWQPFPFMNDHPLRMIWTSVVSVCAISRIVFPHLFISAHTFFISSGGSGWSFIPQYRVPEAFIAQKILLQSLWLDCSASAWQSMRPSSFPLESRFRWFINANPLPFQGMTCWFSFSCKSSSRFPSQR